MFDQQIPKTKDPINLTLHQSFNEKMIAVYDYAKIRNVFLQVSNPRSIKFPLKSLLKVSKINIPLGSLSYVTDTLKECYTILSMETKKYVHGEERFETISATLESCIDKCIQASDEHNIHDMFTFDQKLKFNVYKNKKWHLVTYQSLEWSQKTYEDFKEHFNIRKGFFDQLIKTLRKNLNILHSNPPPEKKPYAWNSKNAELEISELLYVIYRTSGKLTIDASQGGSFSKFKRDFFKLFGLSDKNYDKKVIQILGRKKGDFYIDTLTQKLKEEHAKLFEVKK